MRLQKSNPILGFILKSRWGYQLFHFGFLYVVAATPQDFSTLSIYILCLCFSLKSLIYSPRSFSSMVFSFISNAPSEICFLEAIGRNTPSIIVPFAIKTLRSIKFSATILFQEEHGQETRPTFFMNRNRTKPYHIDYCFVSDKFKVESVRVVEVNCSDHFPLVVFIS